MDASESVSRTTTRTHAVGSLALASAGLLLGVMVVLAVLDPIRFDGWYLWLDRGQTPLSWSTFVEGAKYAHLHGNPRLGQLATIAAYGDSLLLSLTICCSTIVAAAFLIATTVLGRFPKRTDGDFVATMLAIWCVCVPQFGPLFTYKPYLTNYVTGALPGLVLLAAASIHVHRPSKPKVIAMPGATIAALAVGIAAGMGNEHLGPALVFALSVAIVLSRREHNVPRWLIAGALGVAVGTVLLLTAPGQQERYNGIGSVGVVATVMARHPVANVALVLLVPALCLGSAPWFLVARRKPSGWLCVFALVFAAIAGLTTLGSPKIGSRLFFIPAALLGAAAAAALGEKGRLQNRYLSSAVLLITAAGMLWTNLRQFKVYEQRFRMVLTAVPGEALRVPPIPDGFPQWTLKDDFRNPNVVKRLAQSLGLTGIAIQADVRP